MTTNEFRLTGSDVFGRYCRIEMKRFGVPNEFYVHKCIRSYRTNYYRDVPIDFREGEYVHPGRCVDVVGVITCGLDETEVFAVPLDSIQFIEPPNDETSYSLKVLPELAVMQLYMCGRCGAMISGYSDTTTFYAPRFCPNCGASVTSGGETGND